MLEELIITKFFGFNFGYKKKCILRIQNHIIQVKNKTKRVKSKNPFNNQTEMSLLPHSYYPRSMFNTYQWSRPFDNQFYKPYDNFGLTNMDIFDPFDELDNMMATNFHWIQKPEFLKDMPKLPTYPQKYRISVDCAGFDPKSIKTDFHGRKFTVYGKEEYKTSPEDYSTKDFKKTYDLPEHAEVDKYVSFMTPYGSLIFEFPLKETKTSLNQELFPKVVDQNGQKLVKMEFSIPENIDPSNVTVSVKDRDLIFKAEDQVKRPDVSTRFYYYKRSTLPENTDFDHLKCNFEKGKIFVQAPLRTDYKTMNQRNIPIDYKGGYPYQGYQQYQQYPYQQQYGQQQIGQTGQTGQTGQRY